MNFTKADIGELTQREMSVDDAQNQLALLNGDVAPTFVLKPCTKGDGIFAFSSKERATLINEFDSGLTAGCQVARFVPASGAASRMFAHLVAPESDPAKWSEFKKGFKKFPFYPIVKRTIESKGGDINALIAANRWSEIVEYILATEYLNYEQEPKGSIPFHAYANELRTAFQEQVHDTKVLFDQLPEPLIHFTVSPQFSADDRVDLQKYGSDLTAGCRVSVEFSEQLPKTDTLALTASGKIARNPDSTLLFRPGGHGSLIYNLNTFQVDLVFIKNIDNVLPDRLKSQEVGSKKMLGGLLLRLLKRRNDLLERLEGNAVNAAREATEFVQKWFLPDQEVIRFNRDELIRFLDRPMRICGMVRNEGEPGGGPFWMKNNFGHPSVQIVERAQLDTTHSDQRSALMASTHFNPVDLVCGLRNHRGEAYNLLNFVNPKRVFLASKMHGKEKITALERPGLWNGAMENWLSVFVEVSTATFAPVKTVNDLLRPEHKV